MDSRVTMQSIFQGALGDTRRLSDQLALLQTQAATGNRFSKISDDPTATLAVLGSETQAQNLGAHLDNITWATSRLNGSVSTLQQVGDLLSQARTIAIEASSSVNDGAVFQTLAKSVDSLLDRLIRLANTQQEDGAYIFGGTSTRTPPFVVTRTDAQGLPLEVQYRGADNATSMFVDRGQQIALDYRGDQAFQLRDRRATEFTGTTGARSGPGTDTASLRAELRIEHTATTYAPGSGVQAGASATAGDTILGPLGRHRLHITDTSGTGSAGTVSLDGGPPVAFTNADTDLIVTNANGDVVHLDTNAITANFDGDVDIASTGTMSIDGGATTIPLTFAADQSVTDGAGKITHVDTTNVERTGSEAVNYPGTYDAFQSLIALRDDLRNTRQLSEHDQIQALSGNLAEVTRAHTNVLTTVGAQSATLESLQSLQSHLGDLQLNARQTASDLGDVDMTELVVKLQAYQNMLQLSLATFSRIVDQNLLDFLR